jgi:hypothetical protein
MKMKNITSGLIAIAVVLLTSCVYDEADHLITGKGPNQLRFFSNADRLVVAPSLTSEVIIGKVYKDANSPSALDGDASVTYSVDVDVVADYNAEHGTAFVALPADKFTFAPATLVMGAGEFEKDLVIQLNAAGLDLSKDYAIGLTGTADGWEVVGHDFLELVILSPYAGEYVSQGVRYNYNAAGDANVASWPPSGFVSTGPWTFDPTTASTIKANIIALHAANSNGGFGRINVKVTNTPFDSDGVGGAESFLVEIVPNADIGLNAVVQSTHRQSYYTPANPQGTGDKFKLYYEYTNTNGTFRNLEHNLTRK